jgi:hypothetical protein
LLGRMRERWYTPMLSKINWYNLQSDL